MSFQDHFSQHAGLYATFRPHYPQSLFEFLATLVQERQVAWDCATGNGQAAGGLADYFRFVVASDASKNQIAHADRIERVHYCIALGEHPPLLENTVNLITIAQALHWLKLHDFFNAVRRVLKSDGVVVAWSYNFLSIEPKMDSLLLNFYRNIVGSYWPPERKIVEEGYASLVFPFEDIQVPPFNLTAEWTFAELIGYLRTWSATQKYMRAHGTDPVLLIDSELSGMWGNPDQRRVIRWPINMRAGRKA